MMASSDERSAEPTSTAGSHYTRYANLANFAGAGKPSRQRLLQVLFNLYNQKDDWNNYGELNTCCRSCIVLSPVKCWWWMVQIFTLITVSTFTYEFFFRNWLAVVPAIIVAVLEWMAFYKTCLKDPGIMQRPDFVTAVRNLIKVLVAWGEGNSLNRFVVRANGANEQLNYCWKCNHYRALTTNHCGICDCCMLQHDHHCPVYGGCVAKNNISSFHTMIISAGCFWVYSLGYSIYNVATTTETFTGKSNNSTDNTDTDNSSTARITFYLIIAEIAAVLTIPVMISGCRKFKNKRTQTAPHVNDKKTQQLSEEILRFARENSFPAEEELQLREILQIERGSDIEGDAMQRNDLNHNQYYPIA